jgi:hypothetical protein
MSRIGMNKAVVVSHVSDLPSRLGDNEVIEGVMLRQHEIFLDVDESFRTQSSKLVEVARETLAHLLQELTD